jgi:hypothetical protein
MLRIRAPSRGNARTDVQAPPFPWRPCAFQAGKGRYGVVFPAFKAHHTCDFPLGKNVTQTRVLMFFSYFGNPGAWGGSPRCSWVNGYNEAMSFFLDHRDFSLIPDPRDLTQWRGVAHTFEGVKALLALWGTPQDDPEHPLRVFSWSPTSDALEALHTTYPDVAVRALGDPRTHWARWETQKAPPEPTGPRCFSVIKTGRTQTNDTLVFPPCAHEGGGEPPFFFQNEPTVVYSLGSVNPFFWESASSQQEPIFFKKQDTTDGYLGVNVTLIHPHEEAALRACVFQRLAHGLEPKQDPFLGSHDIAQVFLGTREGQLCETLWSQEAFCTPMHTRVYRAFFEHPETLRAHPPALNVPVFRRVAHTYSEAIQREAFLRNIEKRNAEFAYTMAFWEITPRLAAQTWLDQGGASALEKNLSSWHPDCVQAFERLFKHLFKKDDRFFFEALDSARTPLGDRWDTPRPLAPHPLQTVFHIVDLYRGFSQWKTDGAQAFVAAVCEGASLTGGFQKSRHESLTPPMVAAFDDPEFLKALDDTVFWTTLEKAVARHPEWEALLERHLLQTLTPKPVTRKSGVDRA